MKTIYKSFNRYNYTTGALIVDTDNKTALLYKGMYAPLGYDKKTTLKQIKVLYEQLKNTGFNCKEV